MDCLFRVFKKCGKLLASPQAFVGLVAVLRFCGFLRRPAVDRPDTVQRIFVSCLFDSVGDIVLVIPLLESIHLHWPDALIDIAVGERMSELISDIPFVNNVFRFRPSRSKFVALALYGDVFSLVSLYRNEVMRYDYDLALVSRWSPDSFHTKSTYMVYLTGANQRCGYSAAVEIEDVAIDHLLTRAVQGGSYEHESLRNVKLLGRANLIPTELQNEVVASQTIQSLIDISSKNVDGIASELIANESAGFRTGIIVISPGATNPRRIWPAMNYVALAERLQNFYKSGIVLVGSGADRELCDSIASGSSGAIVSLAGNTDIRRVAALIMQATLFIGSDSGTAHIAGALGVPTVVISPYPLSCHEDHPNSPQRFRPCGPRVVVVQPAFPLPGCDPTCNVDETHCIAQVEVDDVISSAMNLLTSTSPNFPYQANKF